MVSVYMYMYIHLVELGSYSLKTKVCNHAAVYVHNMIHWLAIMKFETIGYMYTCGDFKFRPSGGHHNCMESHVYYYTSCC